jgi:peroxidase
MHIEFDFNQKLFNIDQLAEIRNVTLARLLCSNSNAIKQVQLNVFKTVDANNDAEMFDCDSTLIPKLNLQHWVEIIDSNFK